MTKLPAEFCPRCGSSLETTRFEGRERRYCGECDRIVFQQPGVAANVAVVDGKDVLLVERGRPPHANSWALPGGAVEHDEPLAAAATRELLEETNIEASPEDLAPFDTWQHDFSDGVYAVAVGYVVVGVPTRPANPQRVRTRPTCGFDDSTTTTSTGNSDQERKREPNGRSR